jgi:hypothetical protein
MFDQYAVHSIQYHYKTSSGTTTNGATLMAFDYEASDVANVLGALQVQQPRVRSPVWENCRLNVDCQRAMKSKWMLTAGGVSENTPGFTAAGIVVSSAPSGTAGEAFGEVWCTYDVTFVGPTTSNATSAFYANADSGNWQSSPASQTDDAFVIAGVGTQNLTITPRSPGEYYVQLDAGLTSENQPWADFVDTVNNAIASTGNSVRQLALNIDGVGRKLYQFVWGVNTLVGAGATLPAALTGIIGLGVTAYRYGGAVGRVA